tara:strand:- start:382 stop:2160 length:1779 start_codon:yes stop_codon:yes gene_type:complete
MRSFNLKTTILFLLLPFFGKSQIYDTLITEHFDNITNMTSSAGFGGVISSSTCGSANIFNTTTDSRALNCVHYEPSSSVFVCSDKDAVGVGAGAVSVEMLTYTAVDNDEIGFVGYFAAYDFNNLETAEIVELFYSTDNGLTYTSFLILTGNSTENPSYSAPSSTQEGFSCSDGSAAVQSEFINKEFSIGNNLSGQIIKIKVEFSGFTSGSEGVVLDEFSLVKVRNILASENFDNTTFLTTSTGAFNTATEGSCNGSSLYNCTSNMATPSNALDCLGGEDGNVFVMTGGGVASGAELEMLTYTTIDNNEISFRGSFASFGTDQNTDNFIVVAYSTDNGSTYTDAFTVTGIDGGSGTDWHSISDGTSTIGRSFIKKGFVIGSNLSGSTIKIKITYDTYTNGGDGIAIDKFRLEGSLMNTLPVTLVDFSTKLFGEKVHLNWSTSSEINNDYFTLERSLDGEKFNEITIVEGAGNSNNLLKYNFIDDENTLSGTVYYRLKQTDYDGKNSYSKTTSVNVKLENINRWSIFPNPAKEMLNFEGDVVKVELVNILGESVEGIEFVNSRLTFDKVANGTYLVRVWFNDGNTSLKKLVVNH